MATIDDKYVYTPGLSKALRAAGDVGRTDEMANAALQFNALFRNLVGRDPTPEEGDQFYSTHFASRPWEYGDPNSQERQRLRDTATNFISDNFQQQMQDSVNLELKSQQAEANRLGDVYEQQGNAAIDNVQASLLDYQTRLFERIRPNLITSLQTQGILNSGGVNQALAGTQGDLAAEGSKQVADLRFQNEQAANDIRFGGQMAPYQFNQSMALNRIPNMQANAQGSLDRLFQQRVIDQNFANQMALMSHQASLQRNAQPSFLRTLGQNFASSLGQSTGNSIGQWFKPSSAASAGAF